MPVLSPWSPAIACGNAGDGGAQDDGGCRSCTGTSEKYLRKSSGRVSRGMLFVCIGLDGVRKENALRCVL